MFTVFDRSSLLEVMRDRPYIANKYDIPAGYQVAEINDQEITAVNPGIVTPAVGAASPTVSRIAIDKVLARPNYLDQVLPFDIVVTAHNEYGSFARMQIHGVELMNQGSSMSIDDIMISEACTFIATAITPWDKQGFVKINDDGRSSTILGR